MYADIESLVLSGELFNGKEHSSSPERTPSPDAGWHDDELASNEDYDSDTARRRAIDKATAVPQESVGMGPGRTGVKGVIRDRNEAEEMSRAKRNREMDDVRNRLERSNLGGKTYLEEEREKAEYTDEKVDELVLKERERERKTNHFGLAREGRFGHLREVGVEGFVGAVEKEDRGVWVVVHLYDPSLERCYILDDSLARLARNYSDTKFLRARAAALGFASTSSNTAMSRPANGRSKQIGADDPYDEKDAYSDEEPDDPFKDDDVDLDMLPTMLVYRDGELIHNWVRVDWEAGDAGVEELLDKHHILPHRESNSMRFATGNLGLLSDDEEDLIWSDDDVNP